MKFGDFFSGVKKTAVEAARSITQPSVDARQALEQLREEESRLLFDVQEALDTASAVEAAARRERDQDNLDKALYLQDELAGGLKRARAIESKLSSIRIRRIAAEEKLAGVSVLKATTPEGKEIRVDLEVVAKEWQSFYTRSGVTWVSGEFSRRLQVTHEQAKDMEHLLTMGFTDIIVIPKGLVTEPRLDRGKTIPDTKNLARKLMAVLFDRRLSLTPKYLADGGIGASSVGEGGRLVMVKPVAELTADAQYKATVGKSVETLSLESVKSLKIPGFAKDEQGKTLEQLGLLGLDEVSYLMWQRKMIYDGKIKDTGYSTYCPASRRIESGAVPIIGKLDAVSRSLTVHEDSIEHTSPNVGTRLAATFPL